MAEAIDKNFIEYMMKVEGTNIKMTRSGPVHMPYLSPEKDGTYTIGIGHKLPKGAQDDPEWKNGLTESEAIELLYKDIEVHQDLIKEHIGENTWSNLDDNKKQMLTDIQFNVKKGIKKFPKFTKGVLEDNPALILSEYQRSYTDDETGEKKPLKERNKLFFETFLSGYKVPTLESDNLKRKSQQGLLQGIQEDKLSDSPRGGTPSNTY